MKKHTLFPTSRRIAGRMKLRNILPFFALGLTSCEEPTDLESAQPANVESGQSIQGVWRLIEREIQGGSHPRIESGFQVQPSILIYTEQHFSWEFVRGTEPRPLLDGSPSDADIGRVARLYNSAASTESYDSLLTFKSIMGAPVAPK